MVAVVANGVRLCWKPGADSNAVKNSVIVAKERFTEMIPWQRVQIADGKWRIANAGASFAS
jgi:hypothetical protein